MKREVPPESYRLTIQGALACVMTAILVYFPFILANPSP